MGALGPLLGTSGGASGTGFAPPKNAPITSPVTPEQVQASQAGATNALGNSDALLQALGGQSGLSAQSQTYNQGRDLYGQLQGLDGTGIQGTAAAAQAGLNNKLTGLGGTDAMGNSLAGNTGLASELGDAGGVGLQTTGAAGLLDVLGQQRALAGQYQNIANGVGPNPAQAMLNNATGQNIASQAALMAGQRGAGANVGLMARQIGQQGAGIQQQAGGQAALMQSQQQLAALNALAGQQQAMGGTNQSLVGAGAGLTTQQQAALDALYGKGAGATTMQQSGINNQFGQGTGIVGQQTSQLANNAGVAGAMAGNLIGATNQNMTGNLSNAANNLGAAGAYNTNVVNSQGNVNTGNVGLATTAMGGQKDMIGGLMNGLGGAAGMAGGAGGASGKGSGASGPSSGKAGGESGGTGGEFTPVGSDPHVDTGQAGTTNETPGGYAGDDADVDTGGGDEYTAVAAEGGLVGDAQTGVVGPGSSFGKFLHMTMQSGQKPAMAAQGGMTNDFRSGGAVQASSPKEKAVKSGNSYANDKIPAMLSEGEIVIPRNVLQSKDPVNNAADFVAKVLAKRGKK